MLVDILIVLFVAGALYRGFEIGFVRQILSTTGFFGGLFFGALLQPYVIQYVHGETARGLVTIIITFGLAIALLLAGEEVGIRLKRRLITKALNKYDQGFGSAINVVSVLLSAWLLASIVGGLNSIYLEVAVDDSHIVTELNAILPSAPTVIADLGKLIDPSGFPQVFVGDEPSPQSNAPLPSLGSLQQAVDKDRASVVKIVSQGCGGIVDGSGFLVKPNLTVTNAHVVAGIKNPTIQTGKVIHKASVIWFDSQLDLAILQTTDLNGQSIPIVTKIVKSNTSAAVLGYPGGGAFTASPAVIMDSFTAKGRNIYGTGKTTRSVYEVHAKIIPGNSGGPVIDSNGNVIGVVFAESTTYQDVGYALTAPAINDAIKKALAVNQVRDTGRCVE